MFCVSMNAYKMIIFAHSKCKRYENRKIQGVALPKKERNGQEWKSSHHGTVSNVRCTWMQGFLGNTQ